MYSACKWNNQGDGIQPCCISFLIWNQSIFMSVSNCFFLTCIQISVETPNTLSTSWEELTHWKRPWCWEGLGAGGEGEDRGWDGWMASLTWWTWVWVNPGSWWWTGRPGILPFMRSQRVGHNWVTKQIWSELNR